MYPEYQVSILNLVNIILILVIITIYLRVNTLERHFSQLLKNHGVMMRAMRRNELITEDDLVEIAENKNGA